MCTQYRLKALILWLKSGGVIDTQADFATAIGINATNLSTALKGDKRYLNEKLIGRVAKAFPTINPAWLLTGEGEMLREPSQTQTVVGDGNTQVQGSGNTVTPSNGILEKALDGIKGCHAMLQKSQQQIDRLLGIIETMQQQTAKKEEGTKDV